MSWSEIVDDMSELIARNQPKPVKDLIDIKGVKRARCGACYSFVFSGDDFCNACGQRLEWEES